VRQDIAATTLISSQSPGPADLRGAGFVALDDVVLSGP
jgi:hypothetical protein